MRALALLLVGCAPVIHEREAIVGAAALHGTLTSPGGRAPAVVLVSGSGANDRDDTLGPNKPFRDLALGLAARGVAALRYENRAHAGRPAPSLERDIVADAVDAAAWLRAQPEVDPARVFVVGHSFGGTAIPRIARADRAAAGFVIMAGATRPLEDVIVQEAEYVARLDGVIDAREAELLAKLRAQAERVRALAPGDDPPPEELPLGLPASDWRDLAANPPAELVAGETRPILVLQAARDYQVTAEDFRGWQRALAGKPNARFVEYAGLDHLFMPSAGRGPLDYQVPGHVAPEVIADIAAFVR